jgi:hypothetical protein
MGLMWKLGPCLSNRFGVAIAASFLDRQWKKKLEKRFPSLTTEIKEIIYIQL